MNRKLIEKKQKIDRKQIDNGQKINRKFIENRQKIILNKYKKIRL